MTLLETKKEQSVCIVKSILLLFAAVAATLIVVAVLLSRAEAGELTENDLNDRFCKKTGGTREVRHYYTYGQGEQGYILVDCETDHAVIEGGLDKRSSLDSVHQAVFAALLTGKVPAVVIYDTDGEEGRTEYQIRRVAGRLGVMYMRLRVAEEESI